MNQMILTKSPRLKPGSQHILQLWMLIKYVESCPPENNAGVSAVAIKNDKIVNGWMKWKYFGVFCHSEMPIKKGGNLIRVAMAYLEARERMGSKILKEFGDDYYRPSTGIEDSS
ncbi:hypothetical protein CUMW_249980 [Citrus unshiu]|uniref:Uncharacterized protein n=1 Tax=Citrus unshiu TaxID=55188 RepID=A0A2H5QPP2_CITUN|nr:hypothetical protein CUMW_249980 [Citrus unshiu]